MTTNILSKSLAAIQDSGGFRTVYLQYIHQILVMAATKFTHRQTKNRERIDWGRLMLQAITTGNQILKAQALDDLAQRIHALEARVTA